MFYYYGGKRRLASKYPAPAYSVIVEPFAGAAGYSMYHLSNPSIHKIVLIEKDIRVVETWRRLLDMTPEEVLSIEAPPAGQKTDDFLVMTSATSNAIAHCHTMTVTKRMTKPIEIMLRNIANSLPDAKQKVEIVQGNYEDADNINATWFIDPPYQVTGRSSTKNVFPQGMGYTRECDAKTLDYDRLARWIKKRRGQIIVCEQAGANWLPFKSLMVSGDSLGKPAQEVVWTNITEES